MKQKTLAGQLHFEGIGLHTGQNIRLALLPAPVNHGIVFKKNHRGGYLLKVDIANVRGISRGTNLDDGVEVIHTFEHLMSALGSCGISNLVVEIDGEEIPILDGSAWPFYQKIQEVGIVEQDGTLPLWKVVKPCTFEEGGSVLSATPDSSLRLSYTLDYSGTVIGVSHLEIDFEHLNLGEKLLRARTFCLFKEVEAQRAHHQAMGGSLENALVVDGDRILNPEGLRFEEEFAWHKALDFRGDASILCAPLKGHFIGIKSGHRQNIGLLKKMIAEGALVKEGGNEVNQVLEFKDIQKVLPHRYPFLLVDRIVEMNVGKSAVGIKCVTGNEEYFNGHYPGNPVMPGVLIVEALAQVAGVCLLSYAQNIGKTPYLMGIESVKFRKPILPGDRIELCIDVVRLRDSSGKVEGYAKVDGQVHVEGKLSFIIR